RCGVRTPHPTRPRHASAASTRVRGRGYPQPRPRGRRLVIQLDSQMSQVGAFFDVDRTLVSCNTGRLFLRDLRQRGEISFFRALRALGWMAKYHLSLIDLQWVAARVASQMAGWT